MTESPKDVAAVAPETTQQYLRKRRGHFDRKKEVVDEMGATRSEFADATGFNKTGLGFMERLDRMTPEVRLDVLRTVDKIRDDLGPVWSQQETGDLFPDQTPEEKQDAAAENIKRTRTSARRNAKPKDEPAAPPMPYGKPQEEPYPDSLSQSANWRDPIPGVDDDEGPTGEDAPFDVDDPDFLAPDEPEAA